MTKIDRLLDDLTEDESRMLREVLASPDVGHVELSRFLVSEGHDISEAAVRRWRDRQ